MQPNHSIQDPGLLGPHGCDQPVSSNRYWTLAIVLACMGVAFVLYRAWVADDAFITFRHIKNFHAGNGPVFNVGERVQGYSHPLWFMLLLAGSYIMDLYALAVTYGLVLTFSTVLVLAWFLRGCPGRAAYLLAAFVVLFSSRTFVEYSTSGLETALTVLLLTTLFGWIASRELAGEPAWPATAGWLCGLLVLNRPDYVLLCAPIVAGVAYRWWSTRRSEAALPPTNRRQWLGLAAIGLVLAGWYGFATIYYGTPLPNTAYAKTALPLVKALAQSWTYARIYAAEEPLHAVFLVVVLLWALFSGVQRMRTPGRRGLLILCLALAALVHLVYISSIGGDFMRGRVYLPIIVGLTVLAAHLAADRWPASLTLTGRAPALLAVAIIVACALRTNLVLVTMSLVEAVTGMDAEQVLWGSVVTGAAMLAATVVAAVLMMQYNGKGWTPFLLLVPVAGMLAAGVLVRYSLTFTSALIIAALVGSVVLSALRAVPARVAVTVTVTGAVVLAAMGSLCDCTNRRATVVLSGVTDEWAWYAPVPFSNPFSAPPEQLWFYPGLTRACREYAEQYGPITVMLKAIGIFGCHVGPDVRVLDLHGLTDAYVARGYASPSSRIGHPEFEVPGSYLECKGTLNLLPNWIERVMARDASLAREAAEMQRRVVWTDERARRRFESYSEVISGEIFSVSRFRKLPAFIRPARPPSVENPERWVDLH